jgi:Tub family
MAVQYKYEPCDIGNLRRAKVVVPALDHSTGLLKEWRPMVKEESMLRKVVDPSCINDYYCFVDRPPEFNAETKTYQQDFKGRVARASSRNF